MNLTFENILEFYCDLTGFKRQEIMSICRDRFVVTNRMILSHILYNYGNKRSKSHIARMMNKNHATIIHYLKKHDDLVETCPYYQDVFSRSEGLIDWLKDRRKEHGEELLKKHETKNSVLELSKQISKNDVLRKQIKDLSRTNGDLSTMVVTKNETIEKLGIKIAKLKAQL